MAISRASQACDNCARLRLRCDGQPSCARCQSKRVHCSYSARTRRRVAIIQDASQLESSGVASVDDSAAMSTRVSGPPGPGCLSTVDPALLPSSSVETYPPSDMSLGTSTAPNMAPALPANPSDTDSGAMQPRQPRQPQQILQHEEHQHVQPELISPPNSDSIMSSNLLDSSEIFTGGEMQPISGDHMYSMPTSSLSIDYMSQSEMQPYNDFDFDLPFGENQSVTDWMNCSGIYPVVEQPPLKPVSYIARFDHSTPGISDIRHHHGSRRPSMPPEVGLLEGNGVLHLHLQSPGFKFERPPVAHGLESCSFR